MRQAVELVSSQFDSEDVSLAYTDWPGESPSVVFLHGISAGRSVWYRQAELRGRQRALAYDARGHGDSGRTASYHWTEMGSDAIRFIEGIAGEPAILVGHSLGSMISIYVAAERPDLVIGALLIDPPLYSQHDLRDKREAFEQRRALAGMPVDELVAAGLPTEQGALNVSKLDGNVLAYVLDGRAFEGWDIDTLLQRIQCPVWLEHGEPGIGSGLGATAIYEGELERATALIRHCTVVQIKGSGHIPMVQQPEQFQRLVRAFIHEMAHRT